MEQIDAFSSQVSNLRPLKHLLYKAILVQWNLDWVQLGINIGNTPIEIAKQGNEAILRYWAGKVRI